MRFLKSLSLGLVFLALSLPLYAGPKFSSGTTTDNGVQIYRDSDDLTQFYYLPTNIIAQFNPTNGPLKDFNVAYFGISDKYVDVGPEGIRQSVVGASIAGQAGFRLSPEQRASAEAVIQKQFGVKNPKLLPLTIRNVQVTPTLAKNVMGADSAADVVFPSEIRFENDFNFVLAAKTRLFAQMASLSPQGGIGQVTNPQFGMNIIGEAEFVGDPWKASLTVDLGQCWSQIRQRYSASLKIGWFRIGSAEYQSIVQDLERTGLIKVGMIEGTLDNEAQGRQVFDMVKTAFEQLNRAAVNGEGFFRFEPNPEAAPVGGSSGGGGGLFGLWGVSINGGYSSAHFNQKFTFTQVFDYTGRFKVKVPASMTLAVQCTPETKKLFADLNGSPDPCMTPEKLRRLNDRINREQEAQGLRMKAFLDRLTNGLADGTVSPDDYQKRIVAYKVALSQISLTEDVKVVKIEAPSKAIGIASGEVLIPAASEQRLKKLEDDIYSGKSGQ